MVQRSFTLIFLPFCLVLATFHNSFSQMLTSDTTQASYLKRFDKDTYSVQVNAKITGLPIDSLHLIKLEEVFEAIDNKGDSLYLEQPLFKYNFIPHNDLMIMLHAPHGMPEQIVSLKGKLSYFQPDTSTHSLVRRENLKDYYHSNLLKKHPGGLQIMLVDPDYFFDLRWNQEEKYHKILQRLKDEEGIGDEIERFFKQFFSSLPFYGENWRAYYKDHLLLYVNEPHLIYALDLYDAKGRLIDTGYQSIPGDYKYIISLPQGIYIDDYENFTIEIKLKTPESIQEYPIQLEHIQVNNDL